MTISSSPVGQNFVQVYVFVREHQHFCHSSFVYKKRGERLLSSAFKPIIIIIMYAFFPGLLFNFYLFTRRFFYCWGRRRRLNWEKKKFFWILFWKIFWSPALPVYFSGLFYFVYSSSIIVICHDTSEWISRYPWWGSVTRPLKIPRYPWRVILHDTSKH